MWKNVTNTFSEKQRIYNNKYLEIDEIFGDDIEVSLFSSKEGPNEIYFLFGKMYGIIYVKEENAESKREEVKTEIEEEYRKHKEPTDAFINEFCKKNEVSLPSDIFFHDSSLCDF